MTPTATVTPSLLVGVTKVEPFLDTDGAGTAEAFAYQASASGTVTSLAVYLDPSNQASEVRVGLYADLPAHHPGTLLTSGVISSPAKGSWNTVGVPAASVINGNRYWLALLAPTGKGWVNFRAVTRGSASETSQSSRLSGLPLTWAKGQATKASPASLAALSSGPAGGVLVGSAADVGTLTPVAGETGAGTLAASSGSDGAVVDGALPSDLTTTEPSGDSIGGGDQASLP
jgi:hypothetical protein